MKKIAYIWNVARLPIMVFVGMSLLLLIQTCMRRSRTITVLTTVPDSTIYYKDAYGREHAQSKQQILTFQEAELLYKKELEQKAVELRVKPKHIQGSTSYSTTQTLNLDSLLELYASVDTLRITRDTTIYVTKPNQGRITIFDSVSVTAYQKKVGFLKRETFVDVISYNPNVTVKSVRGFQIRHKPPNLTFGPSISYVYTLEGMKVVPGISIQYSLIGVRIGKR